MSKNSNLLRNDCVLRVRKPTAVTRVGQDNRVPIHCNLTDMSLTKDVDSERQNSIRIPITISWEGIKYSVVEKKGPPCKAKKRNKKRKIPPDT